MHAKRALALIAGIVVIASLLPGASASHQQIKFPPHQSGEGNNDVADEIAQNHPLDRGPSVPGNGFGKAPFDVAGEPKLVLESFYEWSSGQVDFDINNILRETMAAAGDPGGHDDYLYPGLGFFNAYWGWWIDKGNGHQLREAGAGSENPNDAIDDAHDNTDRWAEDPNHGQWDEFLWRGKNPWAGDHPFSSQSAPDSTVDRYPGDEMFVFFSPGTKYSGVSYFSDFEKTVPRPGILMNDKDHPRVPEWGFSDRTDYGAYALEAGPSGVPQFGGWVSQNGFWHAQYDDSLLMASQAITAVNPTPSGGNTYEVLQDEDSATATDVDVFAAVHPTVEDAYRTAVWNPDQDYSNDGNAGEEESVTGDGGPRQIAKDQFTTTAGTLSDQIDDIVNEATAPLGPTQGVADDTVFNPQTHEPNHPDDDFNTHASHDPATAYGGVAADSYYRPGGQAWDPDSPNAGTQTYDGYASQENLYLDMRPGLGPPVFTPAITFFPNLNVHPGTNVAGDAGDQSDDDTAGPQFLYFHGNFGTWLDHTGDTFVGDLTEQGRDTSLAKPYDDGNVDDPNDYDDNPNEGVDDDSDFEWDGVGTSGTVTLTLTPNTEDGSWGEAGVYVYSDSQGGFNPYDDTVADVTGGVLFSDQDSFDGSQGRLSRHVLEGPIHLDARANAPGDGDGQFVGNQYLILPQGTVSYSIQVETTATVETPIQRSDGTQIDAGTTVVDVDKVDAWT